jgi:hypothetical protein
MAFELGSRMRPALMMYDIIQAVIQRSCYLDQQTLKLPDMYFQKLVRYMLLPARQPHLGGYASRLPSNDW